MRSAADILSMSTGRETILIGPLSSFGAQAAKSVLRERHSIFQTLQLFISRPNAEEMLRPHLRRWGIDAVSIRATTRHSLIEALARAASTGAIGVARVPDVTLTFAGASLDDQVGKAKPFEAEGPHLPPDLADRMAIVFAMAPDYMEGETKLAFEEAVKSLGMTVIVGGVCAWIGAHFIPGVNIAMLAFDLFFLSTEVLHALEKAAEIIDDVRVAKSRKDLEPAAKAFAMVLAVLIVNGILSRLLKAKSLTKGVGKEGGSTGAKPSLEKKQKAKKKKDRVRENDGDGETKQSSTRGSLFKEPKKGQREGKTVPLTKERRTEIEDGDILAKGKNPDGSDLVLPSAKGWPDLNNEQYASFKTPPNPEVIGPGEKVYRVIGRDGSEKGAYWTRTPPPASEASWRADHAVKNDWNGDGAYVEYTVPPGHKLKVWSGPARAQNSSDKTAALAGGGEQLVIPEAASQITGDLAPKPTPWNR